MDFCTSCGVEQGYLYVDIRIAATMYVGSGESWWVSLEGILGIIM